MALDSQAKRASAIFPNLPFMARVVIADGALDQADAQDVAWFYRGILAPLPFVVPPVVDVAISIPLYDVAISAPQYDVEISLE